MHSGDAFAAAACLTMASCGGVTAGSDPAGHHQPMGPSIPSLSANGGGFGSGNPAQAADGMPWMVPTTAPPPSAGSPPPSTVSRDCRLSPPTVLATAQNPAQIAVDSTTVYWSQSETLSDQLVSLKGPLGIGGFMRTAVGCKAPGGRACCNHSNGPVVLGGVPAMLALDGFFCTGDESAMCCNAPAYGQVVVATGRLVREPSPPSLMAPWRLSKASLCTE